MSAVTADSLTVNEELPSRSRTFSPEVVKRVSELLRGTDDTPAAKNVSVGIFDKEGAARSALVTLNRLLKESGHESAYAGTVRQTDDDKFKAIILNRPAKKVDRKPKPQPAAKRAA